MRFLPKLPIGKFTSAMGSWSRAGGAAVIADPEGE
jgi:hypothetical protein